MSVVIHYQNKIFENLKKLLMIFVKNAIAGRVKTRLAADIGEDKALEIYLKLLHHTLEVAASTDASREVWYSDYTENNDGVDETKFNKKLQQGHHLGDRMKYAFNEAFEAGYKQVIIIGSDCPGLTEEILNEAFQKLKAHDVVFGPSEDGGYYLLGMSEYEPALFERVAWSTGSVLSQSLDNAGKNLRSVAILRELNDIDTVEDLEKSSFYNEG